MFKVEFHKHTGIGDKIATIYSMENCGRQTGEKFAICVPHRDDLVDPHAQHLRHKTAKVTKSICDLFKLKYVIFEEGRGLESILVRSKKSSGEYKEKGYIHYISRIKRFLEEEHEYKPEQAHPLISSQFKRHEGDYVTGQFDSRFAMMHGFGLKIPNIEMIIKKHVGKDKLIILGDQYTGKKGKSGFAWGDNNGPYINPTNEIKYFLTTSLYEIDILAEKLMGCKKFVGADSGMSHLAGALGIPSEVYFLLPKWYARGGLNAKDGQLIPDNEIVNIKDDDINPSLLEFYKCYTHNRCYGRFDFQRKTFI